jgi:anaerobic ribonucleoside-triphosphate reductase activating protein
MHYAKINPCDIANGVGVRVSLFVSGCRNHCKGCFNPETWDFNHGQEFTTDTFETISHALEPYWISGLSILGGEPLEPENRSAVASVCYLVRQRHPSKTIWLYTGSLYEDVKDLEVMKYINILVDGRFVEELKDITLKFRGSSNQRIIDVKQSRKNGRVVLWSDDPIDIMRRCEQ